MKNMQKIILILIMSGQIYAQNNSVIFLFEDVQNIALRYTGDTLNWPIVVSLADRNTKNNTYILTQSDLIQLRTISNMTAKVAEEKNRIRKFITGGATIFAKNELITATSAINMYKDAIKNGNGHEAIKLGDEIKEKVDKVEFFLLENRKIEIQAELKQKNGKVDKRIGLLGSWELAQLGDFFKEADGLKTGSDSYANLGFADGTNIIVNPNTTAILRKSRIDYLNETFNTEINLEEGGLLARLSTMAASKNKYILNANGSRTSLQTTNFYAESDGDETVKLTNYNGIASVSANDVTITIMENEGTLVRKGQPPIPPVKLLASPRYVWTSNDTLIYTDRIIFPFASVNEASFYTVQRSTSANFDVATEEINVVNNSVLLSNLPIGSTFIRVRSVDRLGLKGQYSEPIRIIRSIDYQPPSTFVDNLNGNILFTQTNTATLTGATQPNATILIDNKNIEVDKTGRFIHLLENLKADQMVSVIATDNSGNNTVRGVRVVYLKSEILFNFALSGASGRNPIRIDEPTVTLSSRAYPGMEVIINNKGIVRRLQTDSQGKWGTTMSMKEGELSITFKDIQTGKIYLSKLYAVEAN